MEVKTLRMNRLVEKGVDIPVNVLEPEEWSKLTSDDPTIPRSFRQLRELVRAAFNPERRATLMVASEKRVSRGVITPRYEECGEELYYRIFSALKNPWLTAMERTFIEDIIDADMPAFENSIQTAHFILKWTNQSTNSADNISDSSIISETGNFLEDAWSKYRAVFGRDPYVPPGKSKIEVIFHNIIAFGVASPPEGPIQFDSRSWVSMPGIRQPTSAHELFHKLQYTFGYRTKWNPASPYKWFSEGTCSWSEVFVWKRTSMANKINDFFINPDINLFASDYNSLPFWIFFQTRQQDYPEDNPMISFLNKYEVYGDERKALREVIYEDWPPNNVYCQLDGFFALFSRERLLGHWRDTPDGGQPYPTILDPNGDNILPVLNVTDVPLGYGENYSVSGSVSGLGSDYFRFKLEPDCEGKIFYLESTVPSGGDYSYYLVWEKEGSWKKASFPFSVTGSYSFYETIDLDFADSIVIIISGRGTGGSYEIKATVN